MKSYNDKGEEVVSPFTSLEGRFIRSLANAFLTQSNHVMNLNFRDATFRIINLEDGSVEFLLMTHEGDVIMSVVSATDAKLERDMSHG